MTHVFLLAAAAVAALATHAGAQTPRPPNILLVVTDDLGYGDLSSYGHRDLKTPVIDRLAADGMQFTSYYASVAHLDFQLGRLLDRLDTLGLRDDTLVVFTSDNGAVTTDWRQWYEINLHGSTGNLRGRKGDLYDGGIRVPAIVRWPGHVRPGSVTDTPAIGYDLMPTLAAAAGVAPPGDRPIDGENLVPLLTGRRFSRRDPLYWEFDDKQGFHFAVRDGRWKLLANNDLARVQLYDLQTDRFEVIDVAGANKDVVARLVEFARLRHGDVVRDPLRPVTPPLR